MTSLDTLKISPVFQIFAFAIISNANISVSWAVVIDKSLPVEIIGEILIAIFVCVADRKEFPTRRD